MAMAAPGQLNTTESPTWGSRSVDCFEKLEQIGEGTYGHLLAIVYVAGSKRVSIESLGVVVVTVVVVAAAKVFEDCRPTQAQPIAPYAINDMESV
ncbi:hypothetical protein Ccrd_025669, partial [Cynara cardunculus var. scolymus]